MNENSHKYEYDVDTLSDTAPANVVRMVGKNKRVLEIGCGPGSITKILTQLGNCQVICIELDDEAIKKAAPYCVEVLQADLNSKEWPKLIENFEKFDVVVAADVLEHLYDPWNALKRLVPLINSNGYIVISLPHVGHAAVMACMCNGDFEYRDWGLLDRTHIRFFGFNNYESLFAQADLKIIETSYITKPPEETEFAAGWSKLSNTLQRALMSSNYSEVYQVVFKAVPTNYLGDAVYLTPPKHITRRAAFSSAISWKTRLGQRLSPEFKQLIRENLKMFGIKL